MNRNSSNAAACVAALAMAISATLQAGPTVAAVNETTVDERGVLAEALAPEVVFRYDYDFPMSLEGAPGEYSMQEFRLRAPLPPVLKESFVMLTSLTYRLFDADISSDVLNGDFDLHTVRLPIQAAWLSRSTPWLAIAYVEPGLSTDFNVVNHDSFDLSAAAGAGYRFSPNFMLALGLGFSRNYGDDSIFPALALLWHPSDHFMLSVSPDGVVPEWRVTDDWRLKLKLDFLGGRWTIEDQEERERQLRLTGGSVNLLLEHRLVEQCWVTVGVGLNALANLRIEDDAGTLLQDRDLEQALVLRSGLEWKF